jgi:hypothetical protein
MVDGHGDERVARREHIGPLHLPRGVASLQRLSGGVWIDLLDFVDEAVEVFHVPQIAAAVDF